MQIHIPGTEILNDWTLWTLVETRAALDFIYWSHSKRRCRYARRSAFLTWIE